MAESNRGVNLSPTIALFALFLGLGAIGVFVTTNVRNSSNQQTSTSTQLAPTVPIQQQSSPEESSLKQGTFTFENPTIVPEAPSICSSANLTFDDEGASNSDSNIFIALDPPNGQNVSGGEIRAWVSDEAGGRLPSSATVDSSGNITSHSNPTVDKDSHGYPWEPTLYTTQITSANQNGPYSGDKENGGAPKFPTAVKGKVTPSKSSAWLNIPPHDDPLPFRIGNRVGDGKFVAEFIWNISSLGLSPGTYRLQVAVHDGDSHLAVECTTLVI